LRDGAEVLLVIVLALGLLVIIAALILLGKAA